MAAIIVGLGVERVFEILVVAEEGKIAAMEIAHFVHCVECGITVKLRLAVCLFEILCPDGQNRRLVVHTISSFATSYLLCRKAYKC